MTRVQQCEGARWVGAGLLLLGCSAWWLGCSGDSGRKLDGQKVGGTSQGGAGAKAMQGGSGGAGGTGDFGNSTEKPSESTVRGATPVKPGDLHADCVGETQGAKQVEVDMYIMLDRSDSMLEPTGAGATKWDAIRSAITTFVSDPASEGLGVGLQYFPLGSSGVPEHCMTDNECGMMGGPCLSRVCEPQTANDPIVFCLTDADCPRQLFGRTPCVPLGQCSLDPSFVCLQLGAGGCQDQGDCNPYPGECVAFASCLVANYARPAVEIATLPDNGMALVDSITMMMPVGLTPTPVALSGAINHAGDHAAANPTHRVIAVLATDGLPTECLPDDVLALAQMDEVAGINAAVDVVAGVAADGLAQDPAIETYVIGVFAPEDPNAMQSLEKIAMAGGTDHPFIVDASQDVNQQFLEALDEIRGGTLDCEFNLPQAPDGKDLDYRLVNVELTDASGTRSLEYVQDATHCGESELGWFYDADPLAGGTPTKISVCSNTCDTLRAAGDATVEIRLGCETITPL